MELDKFFLMIFILGMFILGVLWFPRSEGPDRWYYKGTVIHQARCICNYGCATKVLRDNGQEEEWRAMPAYEGTVIYKYCHDVDGEEYCREAWIGKPRKDYKGEKR